MNTKIISALVIIAAMATVIPAFMVPANAQFNTSNSNTQSNTNTATQSQTATNTATGGNGGTSIFGGDANGGDASASSFQNQEIEQGACLSSAQSGAFGTSSTNVSRSDCS